MRDETRGVLLMAGGAALIAANDAATKLLTQSYPVGQVLCLRHAATLLIIVPYVVSVTGWPALRVARWRGQVLRGAMFIGTAALMILSLSLLPLTLVTTIVFASPIFVAMLSAPLLGERVSVRRWGVILMGFCGVVIALKPGETSFQWVLLLPVMTAAINAVRDIVTRQLARTDSSISILFWSTLIVMVAGLV